MEIGNFILVLVISYFIGSLPFGFILVKITRGEDIRDISSGRTGGTNAMRAAGLGIGLFTAALDILKGTTSVWLARAFAPENYWLHILAPIAIIIGHNYSLLLLKREEDGRLRIYGGAGGGPSVGGSIGLWPWSVFILVPVGLFVVFGIGYASVATMSVPLISMLIFAYRAWIGESSWIYVLYGLFAEVLLLWSLRPNIRKLLDGTERVVGWRARRVKPSSEND